MMLRLDDMILVGKKPGGSVPGALYQDARGRKWIVKFSPTAVHARNEVLASTLYREAGLKTPRLELVTWGDLGDGNRGVASLFDETLRQPRRLNVRLNGLLEGYLVDAWLANWDVVGLTYDNIMEDGDDAVRVDVGGALLFRAQGAPKGQAFGPEVKELFTLMDPNVNEQAASVFGYMTYPDHVAGMRMLRWMTDERIDSAVAMCEMPVTMASILKERRDYILSGAGGDDVVMH